MALHCEGAMRRKMGNKLVLVLVALAAMAASVAVAPAQTDSLMPGMVLPDATLGRGPLTTTKTAGVGGTTAGLLVSIAAANASVVTASLGATDTLGVAFSTVGAGGSVEVSTRGVVACVADNNTTIGHMAIVGTGVAGRCRDSGETTGDNISVAVQVIGMWVSVATTGSMATMQFYGPGLRGGKVTTADLPNTTAAKITSVAINHLAGDESVVLMDASGGARIVTLPAAATCTNRVYYIKKVDTSNNTVTVTPNGAETIDGAATVVLSFKESVTIVSDGTGWGIL
jgi:hypothetical protein